MKKYFIDYLLENNKIIFETKDLKKFFDKNYSTLRSELSYYVKEWKIIRLERNKYIINFWEKTK